jgi:hypothetical protein
MMERTTVRLPKDLIKLAKRKAAEEGRTFTALMEDALRSLLSGNGKTAKTKRVLPRISKATGGLMPGIDISNSAALQEMEDLEYIERLNRGFK